MTRKFQFILGAVAAPALAFSVLAQDAPAYKAGTPEAGLNVPCPCGPESAVEAGDIIGATVKNSQGDRLGKVEDLALDLESGRIVQVIISTGGFFGGTLTAVPPQALHCEGTSKTLRLEANREKLAAAPRFEMAKWGEDSDSSHLAGVYAYYGENSACCFVQDGNAVPNGSHKGQCLIPSSRLGQLQKASALMNNSVRNLQDQKLGHVEDILLDLSTGRIPAVILSSGGFHDRDGELSAVPPGAFRYYSDGDPLQLDISKEALCHGPRFRAGQCLDFSQPGYTAGIYQVSSVGPYNTSGTITEADNTAPRSGDRNDRALTPLDQGNSQTDLDTTARIRREIIATKGMSVDGQNVKIITINGLVTLRGPVNSNDEKRLIGAIANGIAPSGRVHNQLEVKLTASNN